MGYAEQQGPSQNAVGCAGHLDSTDSESIKITFWLECSGVPLGTIGQAAAAATAAVLEPSSLPELDPD